MLFVSARRQGLLLAFWLKAMLYVAFFASFGAFVASGTPLGAAEFPGSAAVASLHDAFDELAPRAALLPALALARLSSSAAAPIPVRRTVFLRCERLCAFDRAGGSAGTGSWEPGDGSDIESSSVLKRTTDIGHNRTRSPTSEHGSYTGT